eukprot:TRINITY_DN8441_c0_g4_i1.p1 TRINITY_DN8441_c0_g4~~TRINITY_DN8441_c0_g4_i1.p1  ORF type:complete len:414 (-),score=71.56 TRINITY_DN8441_c0_g4_i1:45-1286(-)
MISRCRISLCRAALRSSRHTLAVSKFTPPHTAGLAREERVVTPPTTDSMANVEGSANAQSVDNAGQLCVHSASDDVHHRVKPGKPYALPPHLARILSSRGIVFDSEEQIGGRGIGPSRADKLAAMRCTVCDTYFAKMFSTAAFTQGVVVVQCPGCHNYHLLADHLGWFLDGPATCKEFMARHGKLLFEGHLNNEALEALTTAADAASAIRASRTEPVDAATPISNDDAVRHRGQWTDTAAARATGRTASEEGLSAQGAAGTEPSDSQSFAARKRTETLTGQTDLERGLAPSAEIRPDYSAALHVDRWADDSPCPSLGVPAAPLFPEFLDKGTVAASKAAKVVSEPEEAMTEADRGHRQHIPAPGRPACVSVSGEMLVSRGGGVLQMVPPQAQEAYERAHPPTAAEKDVFEAAK